MPATALTDIGKYTIEIMVKLTDYPIVFAKTIFTAYVTDCVIILLKKTPVEGQSYNVYTPQIQFSFEDFVQTPACDYTLDYTFWVKNGAVYTALPSFIAAETKTFTVVSKNPKDVANYQLVVRGSAPTGKPQFKDELFIYLNVTNGCLLDKVTASGPVIESFTYQIQKYGPLA